MISAPLRFEPLTAYGYRSLLSSDELSQTALLPGRGILVNDALVAGPVEQLHRFSIGGLGLGTGRRTDLLERAAQLAAVRAIERGPGTGLAHALGGGPDSGHDYL